MLKVKRIKLSGFRGILNPQELDLMEGGTKEPRSLVLYGLNSSGKTSFVDGLEWFLSEGNKINWLRRDEAEEKAYPHQAAKEKGIESYVEVVFHDTESKISTLIKKFDQKRLTVPTRSDEADFTNIYSSFVIRPYFRYLEIVEFVCNKSGKEKYQSLAQWMGFESEFNFQEKISKTVHQKLKDYEKSLSERVSTFEQQLKNLIGGLTALDGEVLNFCNRILKEHKQPECQNINEVWGRISELSKQKSASSVGITIDKLSRIEVILAAAVLKEDLAAETAKLNDKITEFRKEQDMVRKIDLMALYTQALDLITKQTETEIKCPVCGLSWEREKLLMHIQDELALLTKIKEDKEATEMGIASMKTKITQESAVIKSLVDKFKEAQGVINEIKYDKTSSYLESLNNTANLLNSVLRNGTVQIEIDADGYKNVIAEKDTITGLIAAQKTKIQPSAAEIKLADDIAKLTQVESSWRSLSEARLEQEFTAKEIDKFYALKDEVIKFIQDNIKARFNEISDRIGKYFGILRNDKDIKDIKIVLNEERGKAAGRSAEIELNYYNISVRPAYKVLSESLLNSLGLAVYFTCVKQFNDKCKFIVLDDIMNSLDIDKRDTLLDLIEKEFFDYQIILFTHDYYWFQKIIKRFPTWEHKKIKGWDYIGGAKIDSITTTKEEIDGMYPILCKRCLQFNGYLISC
ncbi:MAG: hypothetical protein M1383_05865 [Patescibacteria group bacterium]|nr:hypothetical protein [Patescibacteria group bacterium]